jgi:LuxR family transcriptional regulator, maltose regulon positive regulatory protein
VATETAGAGRHLVLTTKVRPAALRPGLVVRESLLDRLSESVATPVTSIVAPAGWGKTTLLSAWASHSTGSEPIAWLQLDLEDGDPVRLWEYVIAALEEQIGPDLARPRELLGAPGLSPVEGAIPAVLNACASRGSRLTLVLDDLHLIDGTEAMETIELAISHLPPNLRLMLASRTDPELPLARLRARGQLTELRAEDLRMTEDEVAATLAAVSGRQVDAEDAALVEHRTEGWPAGVYLAGLMLRDATDRRDRIRAFAGDHRHIVDYFGLEVLADLDPETRHFLLQVSVLQRFNGSLCDYLLRRDDSRRRLEDLDRRNLFLVPLDFQRRWYRFHHLFRDLLRHERELTDPGGEAVLLQRAAVWFEEHGDTDAAVFHLLAGGHAEAAADLVTRQAVALLNQGRVKTVLRWLDALPEQAYAGNPRLCLLAAWLRSLGRDFQPVPRLLAMAEDAGLEGLEVPGGFSSAAGLVAFLRGGALGFGPAGDLDAAIEAARRAPEAEPNPVGTGFILARSLLGGMLMHADRADEAIAHLEEAFRKGRDIPRATFAWTGAAGAYAIALVLLGDLTRAKSVLSGVLSEDTAGEERHPERVFAVVASGQIASLQGEFDTAARYLAAGARLARFWGQQEWQLLISSWLAEAELRRGYPAAAREAMGEAYDVIDAGRGLPLATRIAEETAARLRLVTRRRTARHGPLVEELTDRELRILELLPSGLPLSTLAERLYLSVNTVKGYAKSLYRKLDASSRHEAVEIARDLGLI